MKRFRFSLEKLLELREYREKEAEQDLARAMGELTSIEARIRSVAEERVLVAADRFAPGRSAADMRNAEFYILRLDKMKDSLIEAAAKAELLVEAARDAFVEASRDKKVLEKLKDKRKSEYRKSTVIEEIKVVDDISSGSAARRGVNDGA
ncbi:MAG: flagellar export protein FliJ [Treponemataceae bacterium]